MGSGQQSATRQPRLRSTAAAGAGSLLSARSSGATMWINRGVLRAEAAQPAQDRPTRPSAPTTRRSRRTRRGRFRRRRARRTLRRKVAARRSGPRTTSQARGSNARAIRRSAIESARASGAESLRAIAAGLNAYARLGRLVGGAGCARITAARLGLMRRMSALEERFKPATLFVLPWRRAKFRPGGLKAMPISLHRIRPGSASRWS